MKNKPLLSLLLLPLLFSCGGNNPQKSVSYGEPTADGFALASLGEDVCFHTDLQEAYLLNEDYEDVPKEANGLKELSLPNPIELSWKDSVGANQYEVQISEEYDFSSPSNYTSKEVKLELYNLKIGTPYFWRIRRVGEERWSDIASFSTEGDTIRNLNIEGVTNCRDIGGKTLKSGKRMKQGNLFRTGNADGITDKGRERMRELGVKTEIDIRDVTEISSSPVGEEVYYYNFKMFYDDYSNYVERNCEAVRKAFGIFADEEAYPIFYHCRIGTDRTGFTTYLLYGLLGAEEEDIYRDYLFSNFGLIEDSRTLHGSGVNNVQLYYDAINAFPGETLQEHCYNFLVSIGVSEEELDNIIRLNTEDVDETDLSVLEGYRPLTVEAKDFISDRSVVSENGLGSVDLHGHIGSYVEADFDLPYAIDCAIYVYAYAKIITPKANESLALEQDDEPLEVSSSTFKELHYRQSNGIYVAARFAESSFPKGVSTIRITCLGGTNNANGYCLRIARIILIPLI